MSEQGGGTSGTSAEPAGVRRGGLPGVVSCIIIFLDEERFLEEAVASVLAQHHPDWELLLVDDGSTDGSPSIARRWAAEHPARVRYLQHPGRANLGMSASRNLGLRHARGEFVAFLDADDAWLPHKLAEQVALMRSQPDVGVVCGATELWFGWAGAGAARPDRRMEVGAPYDRPDAPSPLRDVVVPPPRLATLLYPLGKGHSPSTSNFLVRRAAAEAVGGYEPEFRAMYEDQAFQVKLYLHVPVYVSTTLWDRYRQHGASSSALAARERRLWADRGRFLRWLDAYVAARGHVDPDVRRALDEVLWPFRHPWLFALRRLVSRLLLPSRRRRDDTP